MGDLLVHYGYGLFVTLNPCVLPVLPFVILSALNVNRWGPVALSLGVLGAYAVIGGTLALIFQESVGAVSEGVVGTISASLLIAMGVLFLVPRAYAAFTGTLGRFTSGAQQAAAEAKGTSLSEQFVIGLLLALAWVPCASPALIAASSASLGGDVAFWFTYLRYGFFGLGAVTFILVLGLGARSALMARRNAIASWVTRLKPLMGGALVVMGVLILTGGIFWLEAQLEGTWTHAVSGLDLWLQDRQADVMGDEAPPVPVVTF